MQDLTLRGYVVSRYGSMTALANVLGWSGRKARDVISGRQEPSGKDMDQLADALGVSSPEEFVRIFFPGRSTKWTTI